MVDIMHNMHTGAVPWPAVYSQVLVAHPDHDGAHDELDEGVPLLRGAAVLLHLLHVELLHGAGVVTVVLTLYFLTPCVRAEVRAASEVRRREGDGGARELWRYLHSTLRTRHRHSVTSSAFTTPHSVHTTYKHQAWLQVVEIDVCFH